MDMKYQGELVELKFYQKIYEMGFIISKPFGDNSKYDFIVDSHQCLYKVQVKSVGVRDTTSRANRYRVAAAHDSNCKHSYTKDQIDILVAYVIPCNAWYIIPVEALASVSLSLFPHREGNKSGYYEKYLSAWQLFK